MKQVRVKRIRVQIGVNLRHEIKLGCDAERDKCEMFLTGAGIIIKLGEPFADKYVPFTNIIEADLMKEEL